jgi:E-phenylitaconyl-CoA hydratase
VALLFSVEDGIAFVTLNRPDSMNAIDPETSAELIAAFRRIRQDRDIRVAIITGAGERAFCTGADLKKTMPPPESFAELTFGGAAASHWVEEIETDKPLICAVNGLALGGGLEMALACDIRIAASHAKFGLTEVRIGSIPGAGGTQRLPRTVGLSNAMLMLMTGEPIDAEEALRIGLISRVVDKEQLLDAAKAIAHKIAANAPLAVRAVKSLVKRGMDIPLKTAIYEERLTWGTLRDTKDRIEGRLAFQQKRKPVYRGH